MRRISTICLAFFVIAGCGGGVGERSNTPVNQDSQPSSQPATPQPIVANPVACVEPCEGPALMMEKTNGKGWTNLNLTPNETGELKQALKNTTVTGTDDTAHIHADVQNGQLTFSAEKVQDPTHLTGKEPEITIGIPNSPHSSIPVKLVATPPAMTLLDQKSRSKAQ
jgi:hypothetical protein